MTCPDAATLAEISSLFEGDSRTAIVHLSTCLECQATLALCDQLATVTTPADVPEALFARIDQAIGATARTADTSHAEPSDRAVTRRWHWHTPIPATLCVGGTLALLAAMTPSTASRPTDWPALVMLSVLGGLGFTLLQRRTMS